MRPCAVYFELLCNHQTFIDRKDSGSFFVRAGETVDTYCPNGTLDIYFTFGDDWYGPDYLSGKIPVARLIAKLNFRRHSIMSIRFIQSRTET